eukprot:12815005-Alexandrium_andersonii.AAC.1
MLGQPSSGASPAIPPLRGHEAVRGWARRVPKHIASQCLIVASSWCRHVPSFLSHRCSSNRLAC